MVSTWWSRPMEAESSNVTVSANPTHPVASGSSCSFSWTPRCSPGSFRTRSCAREVHEVSNAAVYVLKLVLMPFCQTSNYPGKWGLLHCKFDHPPPQI